VRGPIGVRFQRSRQTLSRRVGASVLLAVPRDEDVHELSGGASAIWEELHAPRTLTELVDRLALAHGVEPDEIGDQVEGCVRELLSLGALEEVEEFDA
jgi:hypothetical protein